MVPAAAILLFTLLVALGFGVWCMGILDAPTRFESVRRLCTADDSEAVRHAARMLHRGSLVRLQTICDDRSLCSLSVRSRRTRAEE